MIFRRDSSKKVDSLIKKGDRLFSKGNFRKAFAKYRKAIGIDPKRTIVYDKLMEAKDKMPGPWEKEDFAESVGWAMKKQEEENPSLRELHMKLSPEWEKARELALKIFHAGSKEDERIFIEELVSMGEAGTRVAISMLVEIKRRAQKNEEGSES